MSMPKLTKQERDLVLEIICDYADDLAAKSRLDRKEEQEYDHLINAIEILREQEVHE